MSTWVRSTGRPPAPDVASTSTSESSSATATDRRHHGGRRLVVGPRVGVDALLGDRLGQRARVALDHGRRLEPRGIGRGLGELGGELAERQVLALVADQAEGGDVPERGRAAVAEHDLVALGQVEEGGEAVADAADGVLHRGLAVRGAHQGCTGRGERVEVAGLDLRGPGAEAAVGGQEFGGDRDGVGHRRCLPS